MILVVRMLSLKPRFSLSSFTFLKGLFSSSSLSPRQRGEDGCGPVPRIPPPRSGSERAHRSGRGRPAQLSKASPPAWRRQMRSRQRCLPGRTTRPSGCFPCLTTALNPTGLRQDFPRPPSPTRNQRWAWGARTHKHTHPHTHTHAQRPVPRTPPLVMTSMSFPFSSNCLSRIHSIPLANLSLSSPRNSPRG